MSWKPAIEAIQKKIADEEEAADRLWKAADDLSAEADSLSRSGSYAKAAEKYGEAAKKYHEASAAESQIVGKVEVVLAELRAYESPSGEGKPGRN